MKLRKIDISDIKGFKIGNAENMSKGTGCTVVICEEGAVGGVDVRGGAPDTRETDLLRSENTVEGINAVVLSGGSAFGLEASSGVARELSSRGVGFKVGSVCVPIVCGASLFDLQTGDSRAFPDVEMGRKACENAYDGVFEHGNRGAGTGASVGKTLGMQRAMKTGLGTFACADKYLQVGAIAAVNAVGDIYNGAGNIIAGLRSEDGRSIYGTVKSIKTAVHDKQAKEAAEREEQSRYNNPEGRGFKDKESNNKAEIANAIRSAFNRKINENVKTKENYDDYLSADYDNASSDDVGDLAEFYSSDMMVTGHFPKVTSKVVREAYLVQDQTPPTNPPAGEEVKPEDDIDVPTVSDIIGEQSMQSESESREETETREQPETRDEPEIEFVFDDDDLGYDIPFNTTISCVITNAKLTKSQANKLATILHDAYARAIKPVHGTMDGDTIFVLATGEQEVHFDAFAALATDVLQYAIIDAAMSAKSAYGLPAACDIIR